MPGSLASLQPQASSLAPPYRLALCITELEVGGAERALVELATRIDRSRFLPVVYSLGKRPAAGQDELVLRLEGVGVPVHFLDAKSLLHAPRALKKLRALLRQQQPDLLQSFLFHANIVGTLAGRLTGVRSIVTGIRVVERRPLRLWAARRMGRYVDRHVCVSQAVAHFSAAEGGLAAERLVVIPNGVDLKRFQSVQPCPATSLGLPEGRRYIAFVGRLEPQKGLDWLLSHMPAIFAAATAHDLVVVGQGPDREKLQRQCQTLGIAARVQFVGWRSDVPEFLAASSLVLLPSRWEGMPNILLESMASSRPVVASLAAGVREILGPNQEAQTAPLDQPQVFIQKAIAILQQPSFAAVIGRENRLHVEQHFSIAAAVSAYQRLYESLLQRSSTASEK